MQTVLKLCITMTAALGLASASTRAQTWPAKPVRIVIPYAPGGTADTWGRILAEGLTDSLKVQVFADNKPGGGGLVGSAEVARAAPDGHTLVISGIGSHVIAPAINPSVTFEPMKDFTHIAMLGGPPNVFIANPKTGIKTLEDWIGFVKKAAKPAGYGSPGVGSNGHLFGEWFRQKTAISMEHIPYRGAALAVTDIIAGHVPLGSVTVTTAAAHIRSGAVTAIAVSSAGRLASFPEIPTFKELGHDITATTWFSLSGPKGMAADIVNRLNSEVVTVIGAAKVKERLDRDAILFQPMSPAEFTRTMAEEITRWGTIAKAAGVKPE